MLKRIISIVIILVLLISSSVMSDNDDIVVSLGEDLTEDQKNQILDIFGASEDIKIVYVSNGEEREYLLGYVDEELIGSKAISSSYVKKLDKNSGIDVETYNITWVSKDMYKNALVTAGVKDAKIKVAAPFKVSGTAALTGIIKAFEDASGTKIKEDQKRVANEEIAKTGELSKEIGSEKASELIERVKEEIISKNIKDEEEIKKIIIEITADININLNENQLNEIITLMKNISKLNLNLDEINTQLNKISEKINEVVKDNEEVKSILARILDYLRSIFDNIFTMIHKIF